jgi:dihydroorotate dehydrogenase
MKVLSFFTKLLHFFPEEFSHSLALKSLKFLHLIGLLGLLVPKQESNKNPNQHIEKENFLSNFRNKVGFAAGLDKNGDYIDCLGALGVAFIEVGTVTPEAQNGNPRPRLFRNRKDKSLLNRLGFNNKGVDYLVKRLKNRKSEIIVGTSIGKNFYTPNEKAFEDYLLCLGKVYEHTDYVAVNISSPNTENLRELSNKEYLGILLSKIKSKQEDLSSLHGYKPVFIKISPDEQLENLREICNSVLIYKLDGIICSNTTAEHDDKNGNGGLSGQPLKNKATERLKFVKNIIKDKLPIIASGGVMSASDHKEKIDAGADLVQIYTGFIFEGPELVRELVNL